MAAGYYQKLYDSQNNLTQKEPSVICELVYHLALSGKLDKAKDLRLMIIQELKPSARSIYRELHAYPRALELYRLIRGLVPDDVEVCAYIGRCYGRLHQWIDSDIAFQEAIALAQRTKSAVWWIYRDWGHIRARYQYYEEAKDHFDKALRIKPNDASIKSALGYMHWKQGNDQKAFELFEEALKLNPYHEYTLTYFSKFLFETGDYQYAEILSKRLEELEAESKYTPRSEYDIETEYDD